MKENFDFCLEVVLEAEGGFVNHPKDPGGMTNKGITAKTWALWNDKPIEDVTEEEMRSLQFEDIAPIYRKNYWEKVEADRLPTGVDLSVFDMAVNSGYNTATRLIQRILRGCTVDGIMGPQTLGMIKEEYLDNPADLISDYAHERELYYKSLHHFGTFGRGWINRVRKTEDISLVMLD